MIRGMTPFRVWPQQFDIGICTPTGQTVRLDPDEVEQQLLQ